MTTLWTIIVNYNTGRLLPEMFAALERAAAGIDHRCVVIDNASADDSVALLRNEYPQHLILANYCNVGFGRANNQALQHVDGKYVLLLNTDAFVAPDTLAKTLQYMESHPECGALGVRLVGRDGELQPSCRYFPTPVNVFLSRTGLQRFAPWVRMVDDMRWDHASVRECDWVPGCYFLIRREVIDKTGLFDPRYFLYYEEVDLCRRIKQAGWKVVFYPHTSVVHIGGESAKTSGELTSAGRQISALQIESELLYFRKHHGRLGLAWHMLLVSAGAIIVAGKAIMKGRRIAAVVSSRRHASDTWHLLRATRLASQPTR